MRYPDEQSAAAALGAGGVTPEDLREIVVAFPRLRPAVAAYPGTDAPLLGWLAALGDPAVAHQLALRQAPGRLPTPDPSGRPQPTPDGRPQAAPVTTASQGGLRRPALIGVAVLAVVALGIGAAAASPALFGTHLPSLVPTATATPAAEPGDLTLTGPAQRGSAWAGGYQEAWRVDPVALVDAAEPGSDAALPGYGGRAADTVAFTADTATASGTAVGIDADSGSMTWVGYTQESCLGVVEGRLRCQGGRMGAYPTDLVDLRTGKVSTIATTSELGTGIPEGQEDSYGWQTSVTDGLLLGYWEPDGDGYAPAPHRAVLARLDDSGSRLAWQSEPWVDENATDWTTTGLRVPGRLHHSILTNHAIAVDADTGAILLGGTGSGTTVQWVADDVLQGADGATTITAPDGSRVYLSGTGGVTITSDALPPYPLIRSGAAISAFDPAVASATEGQRLWTTPIGLAEDGDAASRDGSAAGVLAAYHDGLLALTTRPAAGDGSARVVLLDASDGSLLWSRTLARPQGGSTWELVPAFTSDGTVLLQAVGWDSDEYGSRTFTGRLTALDPDDGHALWARDGLLAGTDPVTIGAAAFAPDTEAYRDLVVDNLDGSFSLLTPAAAPEAVVPADLPGCPDGMTAVSWSHYADGSVLLCRTGDRYRAVFTDATRTDWQPAGISFGSGGFQLSFSNGGVLQSRLGGTLVSLTLDGATTTYVSSQAWSATTGQTGFTNSPSGIVPCPAGAWPVSLSTWAGGWLLVCATSAGPDLLAWADDSLGSGSSGQVEAGERSYCATAGSARVCVYASPAVVSLTGADGATTQRTVVDNWFPDSGAGGAGQGTGSYQVPAPGASDADQVRYLLDILKKSRAARRELNPAIADVTACRRVPAAVSTIAGVEQNRSDLLAALDSTPVDLIEGGDALVALLRRALSASREADAAWLEWAEAERRNGCAHGSASSLYAAAARVNRRVTGPKQDFVRAWNDQVAPVYGVSEFSRDEI